MSETYGTTGTQNDATRELGAVEVSPTTGSTTGTGGGGVTDRGTTGASGTGDTMDVAKEEVRATGEQATEGARRIAEVGKDEATNVARETTQQAKELWQQTRTELLDQSAQQQTRVVQGLRSLSQELSSMTRSSDQQGVASDLAKEASARIGNLASWLDQRDPGSLVSEVKQFARRRPGAFLATAAVIGLIGGRLSRGLVADHEDQSSAEGQAARVSGAPSPVDHSTSGYSAYGSPSGAATPGGEHPVTETLTVAGGVHGGTGPIGGTGSDKGESPR